MSKLGRFGEPCFDRFVGWRQFDIGRIVWVEKPLGRRQGHVGFAEPGGDEKPSPVVLFEHLDRPVGRLHVMGACVCCGLEAVVPGLAVLFLFGRSSLSAPDKIAAHVPGRLVVHAAVENGPLPGREISVRLEMRRQGHRIGKRVAEPRQVVQHTR